MNSPKTIPFVVQIHEVQASNQVLWLEEIGCLSAGPGLLLILYFVSEPANLAADGVMTVSEVSTVSDCLSRHRNREQTGEALPGRSPW